MRLKTYGAIVVTLLLAMTLFAGSASAATTPGVTIPVSGTFTNPATAAAGNLVGTLNVQKFVAQNGQLFAQGTFVGTLTNAATGAVQNIVSNVLVPVTAASGSCQVLNLTLGPVDLNLLGLQVHLNQVVLNITAQAGSGNLLGNLLCDVANLLNNNGPLGSLLASLNNLLGQL